MFDSGRNFTYLLHCLISSIYFQLTEVRCINVQCSLILGFFKINPVNGLAFVCLPFHFMMLGSSYALSNYQFSES